MATLIDESDPPASAPGPAPFWVWLLVVGLSALAIYAGYTALSNNHLYLDSEAARQALSRDKDRLTANVADLKQQVEQATAQKQQTETALRQSRADTAAATQQITDLQGHVTDLLNKMKGLEAALAMSEAKIKQADEARGALEREVASLKGDLNTAQKKLDEALDDLSAARQQVQRLQQPAPSAEAPTAPPAPSTAPTPPAAGTPAPPAATTPPPKP